MGFLNSPEHPASSGSDGQARACSCWPMFNPIALATTPGRLFVHKLITQRTAGARVGLSPTGRGARRPAETKKTWHLPAFDPPPPPASWQNTSLPGPASGRSSIIGGSLETISKMSTFSVQKPSSNFPPRPLPPSRGSGKGVSEEGSEWELACLTPGLSWG